jgi:molecular chaperone GrpE
MSIENQEQGVIEWAGEKGGTAPLPAESPQPEESGVAAPGSALGIDRDDLLLKLQGAMERVAVAVAEVQARLTGLEGSVEETKKLVSFLPPQVRALGGKVDGLGTSINEPRIRSMLLGLVGISDLVEQMARQARLEPGSPEASQATDFEVLATQLGQMLALNGLERIPTEGGFNPEFHRAVGRVEVVAPGDANRVLEVVRPGFRTEQAVLRYAEVVVGKYAPPAREEPDPMADRPTDQG